MHVAVMGAGSLGSLIGGLLATDHEVTLVGRESHMRVVAEEGLAITGQLERRVHPRTTTDYGTLADADVDVCLVTVKSFDTATAAADLAPVAPPTVISLQNGLGNEATLRDRLPPRSTVLAGTTTYAAIAETPGHVRCTGRGTVVMGAPDGGRSPIAERVGQAFDEAGLSTRVAPDMPDRIWRKLAVNAGINPVTALAGVENRAITESPLDWIAQQAARETAAVARSIGLGTDPAEAAAAVADVAAATANNTSSMARDLQREQRTEIDAINGAVVRRASDTAVPVNRTLAGIVRAREQALGLREEP